MKPILKLHLVDGLLVVHATNNHMESFPNTF